MIGDEFCYNTVQQHFKDKKGNDQAGLYSFNTFEVSQFVSSKYKSHNPSPLGRIINNLIYALNKHLMLPKLIVVVVDEDLVRAIRVSRITAADVSSIIEWLMKEFTRAIDEYKENLPAKCKRPNLPHVLWMCPPQHKYFGKSSNLRHEMVSNALENSVKHFEGMSSLRIIKSWNPEDSNLFVYDSYRFTSQGLAKYWSGVDVAIRFWNVASFPKIGHKNKREDPARSARKQRPNLNQYTWRKK